MPVTQKAVHVSCDDEVHRVFADFESRGEMQGVEFLITFDKIVVGKKFPVDTEWNDLVAYASTLDDARYFAWEYKYTSDAGVHGSKLVIIYYMPKDMDTPTKELYEAGKTALKKGMAYPKHMIEIESHRLSDLEHKEILKRFDHTCH